MAESQYLPGQTATCATCNTKVTFGVNNKWLHTDKDSYLKQQHPITKLLISRDRITPQISEAYKATLLSAVGNQIKQGQSKPNYLPGQKGECARCGLESTLRPDGMWIHTAKGTRPNHPVRGVVAIEPEHLITPEQSDNFLSTEGARLERQKKEEKSREPLPPPAEEPFSVSSKPPRTTANCPKCSKRVITQIHEETGKNVWVHVDGPVHAEPILDDKIPHTTVRQPKRTEEEKEKLGYRPVGQTKIDPETGIISIPGRPEKYRFDRETGQLMVIKEERPAETLETDPDYVDASGKITSKREAILSKATRVEKSEILRGEKHLAEYHPWISEDIESTLRADEGDSNIERVVDEKGNVNKRVLNQTPQGDLTSSFGVSNPGESNPSEIPSRVTPWKGAKSVLDIMIGKAKQAYVDWAHRHKEKYDTKDQYEYQVHVEPDVYIEEKNETVPVIRVRRRLKYCSLCAPTVLEDGTIPHAETNPLLRRVPNPNQKITRPEPVELPAATKTQSAERNGKIRIWHQGKGQVLWSDTQSQINEAREQKRTSGFTLGSGEGK